MNGKAIGALAVALITQFWPGGTPHAIGMYTWMAVSPSAHQPPANRQALPNPGVRLFRAGQYMQAASHFLARTQQALACGNLSQAVSSINDLAGCHFATFQYKQAMRHYLEAKRLAEQAGVRDHLPGLWANISSLYFQLGEVEAARYAAEQGLRSLPPGMVPHYRPLLMLQLAKVYFRLGEHAAGTRLYQAAIEEAAQRGDVEAQARGWDHFGWDLLFAGDLHAAERALTEAFRLRRLSKSPAEALSYQKLGLLKLAQGDLQSAEVFIQKAVDVCRFSAATIPPWGVYHARGQLRAAQGRMRAALEDFRTALLLARRWKLEALPADSVRIAAGVGLEQISNSFVNTGNRLYLRQPNRALAEETLAAAEENRAWALRSLLVSRARTEAALPEAYWQTLAGLQRAEVAVLASGSPTARQQASRLRAALTEMETQAGLAVRAGVARLATAPGSLVRRIQKVLAPDGALFVFHIGENESWVWALTRADFALYHIAGRNTITPLTVRFRNAVIHGAPEAGQLGAELYKALFGACPRTVLAKRDWILVADDALHHIPLAALNAGRNSAEIHYLIRDHSLRFAPACAMLEPAKPLEGKFLAVGDAIYNRADPRWPRTPGAPNSWWRPWFSWWPFPHAVARAATGGSEPVVQLSRLVGSRQEIHASARAWGSPPQPATLLMGMDASIAGLQRELGRKPAIVHLAAHFLRGPDSACQVGVALSLRPDGQVELLVPQAVSGLRCPGSLVVLSGCSSASYPSTADSERLARATAYSLQAGESPRLALPAEGIPGLSRAWLAAGARAVVGSLWPTPDDTGQLFQSFYSALRRGATSRNGSEIAQALRQAQLEMLATKSWRSQPRYWAAFFITGKE